MDLEDPTWRRFEHTTHERSDSCVRVEVPVRDVWAGTAQESGIAHNLTQ